jgi:Zn finger protein HypA/HybF involved in hydrogenase expression
MPIKELDPNNLGIDDDWEGNEAAFRCHHCGKVFIVSGARIHGGERKCPECKKSTGRCDIKGRKSGGISSLVW